MGGPTWLEARGSRGAQGVGEQGTQQWPPGNVCRCGRHRPRADFGQARSPSDWQINAFDIFLTAFLFFVTAFLETCFYMACLCLGFLRLACAMNKTTHRVHVYTT